MDNIFAKDDFVILTMLYVANVDGKIQPDEIRAMLEHFEPSKVAEVRRKFNKMNDAELIRCIEDNKERLLPTAADKTQLMQDLQKIVEVDGHRLPIEEYILQAVEALLA